MTVDVAQSGPPPKSLPSRMLGMLVSPAETFRGLIAHPRWLDAMVVVTLVIAGLQFWLLSTDAGQQALLDQQVRQLESFGMTVTDQQYEGMQKGVVNGRYFAAGATLVIGPLMTLIIGGILYAVFNAGLGGNARFKQMLSVVTHAGVVPLLSALFATPLNYVRESMTSPTTLAVFLPMLEEGTLLGRFLGLIDLFLIWWIVVLSIGLAVLYRRRTGPILAGLMSVYVAIVGIIALVMRAFGGSN
jgi:hypothetical protein